MPGLLAASDPGLLAAFGGGLISFLSPCVLPLVPGYLSLMSGLGSADLAEPSAVQMRHLLRSTLLFVAGFTVVFVALGASASAIGQALVDHQEGLNRVAGVIVIVMGLVLAGLAAPRALMQERRFHVLPSALGAWAPPVVGMAFAFGWSPCIGPVLAGVLSLAATDGTLDRGVLLLFVYSLGLGVPFVISGLAFGRLTGVFAWFKRHTRVINGVAGAILVGFGVLLVTNRVFWLSRRLVDAMDRVGLDWLTQI